MDPCKMLRSSFEVIKIGKVFRKLEEKGPAWPPSLNSWEPLWAKCGRISSSENGRSPCGEDLPSAKWNLMRVYFYSTGYVEADLRSRGHGAQKGLSFVQKLGFCKAHFAMSSGVGCHKLASLAIFAMAQSKKASLISKWARKF